MRNIKTSKKSHKMFIGHFYLLMSITRRIMYLFGYAKAIIDIDISIYTCLYVYVYIVHVYIAIYEPPSQVTSNSIIAQSLLCAPVTHSDLSWEIDGEWWLLFSLPLSLSLSLCLSSLTELSPVFRSFSLSFLLFSFHLAILFSSLTLFRV